VAEIRPFRGLHYAERDVSAFVCPPFDVISTDEQRRLYENSAYNAVRLECGETRPDDSTSDNRYTRAAATLRDWLEEGILVQDDKPSFYVDDQRFEHDGGVLFRRSLFARVRLHDWDEGPVRAHEYTLNRPKEDRLQLLRAARLNVSPILSLYRDDDRRLREIADSACAQSSFLARADIGTEQHDMCRLERGTFLESIQRLASAKTFYVIDGHHRYETALAYRDELRSQARRWTGEEPENFVLMALIACDDPGLIVLPTHRLLRDVVLPDDFMAQLERFFSVENVSASAWPSMQQQIAKAAKEGPAIGVAMPGRRLILRVRNPYAVADTMPPESPVSWRSLDAAVLEAVILHGILGMGQQEASANGSLEFTHEGSEAVRLVDSSEYDAAFLLSPANVDTVLSMADADERMPQKSTYFYPKVPAGLIMNLLA
jgi:uncharacterized protein (DUF1015 family)